MRNLGGRFQRLWLATVVSALGDGMLLSGFQLLSARQTKNEFDISAVYAIGRIPWAAALLLGTWVDRRNAKTVLVGMDLFRAAVLGLLGFLLLTRPASVTLVVLITTAFLLNAASVCFFCGIQRALPIVIADQHLEKANGFQEVALTAGEQLVGPPLGGVLFLAGKGPIIGDAISFAGSAALLVSLPSMPPTVQSEGAFRDISQGMSFFLSSPVLRSLTAAIAAASFLQAYTLSTLVIVGKITFHLSDARFGIFLAAIALGNIVGGLVGPRVVTRLGPTTVPSALIIAGLCYLACVGSRSPTLVAVFLGIEGIGIIAGNVFNGAARTRLTPPHLRGRVVGLSRAFIYGAQVPGALTAGIIARQLGTDWVFGVAGVAFVLLGVSIARPLQRTLLANPGWRAQH
jgi:predicted MFS family arabinose efflux permease